jgi:hypothetical protein
MDLKIKNRIPVAEALEGEELVYGTDSEGVPQYIPVRLIKEVTEDAEASAQLASEKADAAEQARTRVEELLPLLEAAKAEVQALLVECRNIMVQTGYQKERALAVANVVISEREAIEQLAEETRINTFAAQMAKEYADQAARSASSRDSFEILPVDFDSGVDQHEFHVPAGWYPLLVVVDGRLRRRGKNKDWTSSFGGTIETVYLIIPPAPNTWVSIICGRRH